RELITIDWRLSWPEVVMEVNRVTSDLICSQSSDLSLLVEFRVVQHSHSSATHLAHFHKTQIDFGARHKDHVATSAGRVFRTDDNVAAEIADVRQEFEVVFSGSRAFMVVLESRAQSDLIFRDRCALDFLVLPLVIASPLTFPQLTGIRNHNVVAGLPAFHGLIEYQRRLPC